MRSTTNRREAGATISAAAPFRSSLLFILACRSAAICFSCFFVLATTSSSAVDDGSSDNPLATTTMMHRKLAGTDNDMDEAAFQKLLQSHNDLLKQSDEEVVKVSGPTYFPPPTHKVGDDGVPYLKPALGTHRKDQDAVVAYASEYQIQNYVVFIESLRRTGYKGDIVLSVTEGDLKNKEIHDYLSNAEGVVVYSPEHVCYNFEGEVVDNAKGGMRTCRLNNLWGTKGEDGSVTVEPGDPRPQRTLATARYEIYWIIIMNYDPNSWILVVDARDTYFQANPFTDVPRNTDPSGQSGLLYYFGENIEATRLGLSPQNSKWLNTAYGDAVARALKDKPTICSGASMGEQIAMESYVRAMVAEADETGTVLMGADQGFHNFMYYSGKLRNSMRIHDIVVFDQGMLYYFKREQPTIGQLLNSSLLFFPLFCSFKVLELLTTWERKFFSSSSKSTLNSEPYATDT